ncbi:unnamed protein product [Dibothriocephalus latus]|uniref:Uncharacterized protein n=1 Tax=Dibothriocephalus latus TaxID=60516 RepID=A0A3P7LK79_DIBLA|nr:unnamed protein product [Dibothriocephalus latus]
MADIIHIGRIPADPTVFSLQVQKEWNKKKKDKKDDSPVQLYLIRIDDSTAVDTFFDAVNAYKANSTALGVRPAETGSLTEGQNTVTTRNEADEEGSDANNEDSAAGKKKKKKKNDKKKKDKEKKTKNKEKQNKKAKAKNSTSEAPRDSDQDEVVLGESASDAGAGQPPADSQYSYFGFPGSEPDMRRSQPKGASPSRYEDTVNELPAVIQQGNRPGYKETYIEYPPRVENNREAQRRRSRMEVDAWPPRSYSRRRVSMPPPSESPMSSASSELTLSCSVTPTYRNVDREEGFREDRRRRGGRNKSYVCRDQDSIFYGARMSPNSQMLDQFVRQMCPIRYED